MTVTFFNWQAGVQPGPPYDRLSPNLLAVRDEIGKRFGGSSLGGFGVRPIRAGVSWSSHSFGAAIDWRIEDHNMRAACIDWLVTNHVVLGIQAIHDYFGCRIWRANRYPSQDPATWWRPQVKSSSTGMGQTWAVYLHIETDQSNWHNNTPVPNRSGVSTNEPTPPPPPIVFKPARGIWGLYPLNPSKATLRRTDAPVTREIADLTRYLQGVMRLKAGQPVTIDGDFGPRTDEAVRNVQRFFGLVVDGIVGPKTWGVIDMLAGR